METSRFTRRAASLGVFGLLWVVTIGFACPEKCDCTSDGWVRCNARGLEAVPISIPVNATRLYLNDNNIQNLTDTDFSNLTSLRHLDLSNNDIRVLPGGVFSNLTRLWLLDLADNHITHLPDGIFSNLISLALLYLKSNHISSLPAGVFSYLTNLDQLYLSGNNLADLADGVFSQLTSLVYLYLDDNEISSLSDEVLSNLTLRSLDLSYNRITSLPDGVSSYITDDVRRDLRLAGNPWRCDCSFQRQLISESLRTLIADDPTCSSPPHMEGQNLKRVESDTVCQHRGDCTTGRSDGSCACKVSWTGTYCEKEANLALGKKATSSTGIYGRPEKAVDGSWEECAVTSRWWKVDLGAYYVVNRVRAVSSGNLQHATVRVGPNENVTQNNQCGQMEVIGSAIMPTEFNCDPLISARYVSVHIVHFRQMLLCEVEVYVTDICCDDAIAVLNGQITASNGFCSGNDAQFSCDPGYELVGRSTVTCQGNGSWDGEIPTCERVCCDNTTEVMNGQVNATDGYCFGDDIQFSCDPGHELVGRSNATCQEDGSWGRELPTCQRICCDDTIEILNGQITASNGFCSGNDAQFSCDPGYELVGRFTVTCQEDRRWDGEIPTCRRLCCDNTTEIINGQVNATDGYCYGDDIQFFCDPGYELIGRSSATCQDDGSWGRELPTCKLHTEESSTSNGAIVGAIFGGAFAVVVVVVVVVAVRRRRTKRGSQEYTEMEDITVQWNRTSRDSEGVVQILLPRPQTATTEFPKFEVDPKKVTLGKKIGSGAFGLVYRATLTRNDVKEDVVVKTVKENADDKDKDRFIDEIRVVVNLGVHENLLGLVNCCTVVRDHLYLITEFMPYGDLKSFLTKCWQRKASDGPRDDIYNFGVKQIYQVARQIACGMDCIEKAKYVHGDLAARNVLVGERLTVKISDFGLSEDINSKGYRRQDPSQMIPFKWMAPERLGVNDQEKFTTKSDVWSFGIVLYEICTLGREPYHGMESRSELIDMLQTGDRMSQPEGCPQAMYDMMMECWSLEPIGRPSFGRLVLQLHEPDESMESADRSDRPCSPGYVMRYGQLPVLETTPRSAI